MLTFKVSLLPVQVSRILSFFTFLTLMPFLAPQLSYLYNDGSKCMQQGIKPQILNPYSYLLLEQWLFNGAYIKLAMCGITILFIRIRIELKNHIPLLIAAQGNLLTLYWLFSFGWYVAGGVMLFQYIPYQDTKTCDPSLAGFVEADIVCNYILFPFGLILSRLRPSFGVEAEPEMKITRGQTQLTNK